MGLSLDQFKKLPGFLHCMHLMFAIFVTILFLPCQGGDVMLAWRIIVGIFGIIALIVVIWMFVGEPPKDTLKWYYLAGAVIILIIACVGYGVGAAGHLGFEGWALSMGLVTVYTCSFAGGG